MKKFFIILGAIFFALIVLAVIGIAFVALRGNALDEEAKTYADAAISDIVTTWSEKDLMDRASPELKQAATADDFIGCFGGSAALVAYRSANQRKVRPSCLPHRRPAR